MASISLTLTVQSQAALAQLQAFARQVGATFGPATSGIGAANTAATAFGLSLKRIGEIASGIGLAAGFAAAGRAMRDLVTTGIDYNKNLESTKLGIAAVVAATNEISDAQGRQLTGSEKIAAAQQITSDIYRQIQKDAILTVATTQELVSAFQQAVGPAAAAGLSLEKTRDITKDIVLAWGAMGRPMHMVAQEARALLSGDIDRNAELAKALGITGEMVKQARAQGTLYEMLKDKLKDFSAAADATAGTFQGLLSTVKDVAEILLGRAFSGVFGVIKEQLKSIKESLMDSSGNIRKEWVQGLQDVSSLLTGIAKATAFILEGWVKITAEVFRQQRMFEAMEFNQQVAEVERLAKALQEAVDAKAFPAQIKALQGHLDAANKKLQEMIRHRAELEEKSPPGSEVLGLTVDPKAAQTLDETKEKATALETAMKPLAALFGLLKAQYDAGDLSAKEYTETLDQLILSAEELAPVTVEDRTALIQFKESMRDAIGGVNQAAEDTSKFKLVLQELGDGLGNLDNELAAGFAERFAKDMESLPGKVEDLVGKMELLRDAGQMTGLEFDRALKTLIEGLEATPNKSEAAQDALLRLKIRSQEWGAVLRDVSMFIDRDLGDDLSQLDARLKAGFAQRKVEAGFLQAFADGFMEVWRRAGDMMLAFVDLGRKVATSLAGAFSDLFFSVMTQGFDDLKNVWDNFLTSILRAIADFLAQAAVRAFINLVGSIITGQGVNITIGGGGGGGGASGGAIPGTNVSTGSGTADAVIGTAVSTGVMAGIKAAWGSAATAMGLPPILGGAATGGAAVGGTAAGTTGIGAGVGASGTAVVGAGGAGAAGAGAGAGAGGGGAAAGASAGMAGLGIAAAGMAATILLGMALEPVFQKDPKKQFLRGAEMMDENLQDLRQQLDESGFLDPAAVEAFKRQAIRSGTRFIDAEGKVTSEGMDELVARFGEDAERIRQSIEESGEFVTREQARTIDAIVSGNQQAIDVATRQSAELQVTLTNGQQVMVEAVTLSNGETVQRILDANGEATNQIIDSQGRIGEIITEGDVTMIRLMDEQADVEAESIERLAEANDQRSRIFDMVSSLPGVENLSAEAVDALVNIIDRTQDLGGDVQGVIEAILNELVPGQEEANRQLAEIATQELVVNVEVTIGGEGMAHGGIVRAPTFGLIGEAGPEAVLPLQGRGLEMLHGAMRHGGFDDRDLMEEQNELLRKQNKLIDEQNRILRRRAAPGFGGPI